MQSKYSSIQGTSLTSTSEMENWRGTLSLGGMWEGWRLDVKTDFELLSCENGSPMDTVINHQLKVTCVVIC